MHSLPHRHTIPDSSQLWSGSFSTNCHTRFGCLTGKIQIFPYAFKTYGGTAVILRRIPSVFPFIQKKLRFHLILTGHGIILRAQLPQSCCALKYLRRNGGPDVSGVCAPLTDLAIEDGAVVDACVSMIRAAIEKYC